MKLCAIQIPYAHSLDTVESSVNFAIEQLNSCDSSCDLILLPEYANAPAAFPYEELIPFVRKHTPRLIEAAKKTALRCNAIVAVNYFCEVKPDCFRNTTRVFDRQGNIAGDFYKQHLPGSEKRGCKPDFSYTRKFRAPDIIEVDGIRFGFLICYDTYYSEYVAHIAHHHPDIVLVSSFQRAERQDMLEMLNQHLAFYCNSYVLRASVSMGENAEVGGNSMVVSPDGKILARYGSKTGILSCEISDPHYKYMRSNSFSGGMITNDHFIEQGRTPWAYRPCGSMVIEPEQDHPYPRVCAHRGFNFVAPENTMPAFGAAIALGAPEIELDIHFSKDGIPMVSHDSTLERVSNGSGELSSKTYAELKELDFGSRFNENFAGTRIASFEEVLSKFARQAIINLHIKSVGKSYPEEYFRKIVELLKRYDHMEHVYLMATAEIMEVALKIAPEIPRCMSADPDPWTIVDRAIEYKCSKVQLYRQYYNQEMIDKAHAQGILCNYFFCDTPEEARKFFEMGIDTILTNNYLAISQVRDEFVKSRQK